jgi:hypothetical protein
MLEDLCLASVAADPVMPCLDRYMDCIASTVEELPRNPSKSKFLAFMASRPKATNGTVEAALQKDCFPLDHEAFAPLRAILIELASG